MKNRFSPSYRRALKVRASVTYDVADAAFMRIADGNTHVEWHAWQTVRAWEWSDERISRLCALLYRTGDRLTELSQA